MLSPRRIGKDFMHALVGVVVFVVAAGSAAQAASAKQGQATARGRVLLVRGGFTVFSLGLDILADNLRRAGYQVDVSPTSLAPVAATRIADELRGQNGLPLVIIGHSAGADLTPHLARYFQGRGIPVRLAVLLDSPLPSSIPNNVQRCVNIYNSQAWSAPVLSGRATSGEGRTEVFNVDLAQLRGRIPEGGIDHFTIDASAWIHQVVARAVRLSCEGSGEPAAETLEAVPEQAASMESRTAARRVDPPRNADLGPQFRR
jgi:hypothetical protein